MQQGGTAGNRIGINGTVGTKSPDEFFRSALYQNICYCVRNTAKTVNETADDLGVSPVYVETEAGFLEKYGFLQMQRDKYIVNFIISEPTAELQFCPLDTDPLYCGLLRREADGEAVMESVPAHLIER